jgi:energy-coupling factor transporter ATP-binding protein EcfA2
MRLDRIHVRRFGRIEGLDTGPGALGDLVVVTGPNEAGKSTFFRFLTSLLYGFQPANREQNRDAPWSGEDAEGTVWIHTADGQSIEVHRRLGGTPVGRLTLGDREEDLRNRSVGLVERLPRTVFRQVFALTLAEVAALEAGSWSKVQDRLVSAMGARDLVSPRDAAKQLEDEAGALWRPNRRGKQRIRLIGERIRAVEGRREEALERDRQVRALVSRVHDGKERLEGANGERLEIQRLEGRLTRLLPVHRQSKRIEELERAAGDPAELAELPADPADHLAGLRARSRTLAARVQELEGLESALRENHRRARSISEELFGREWTDADRAAIRGASPVAVRERLREYLVARDAVRLAEARSASPPTELPRPTGRRRLAAGVAAAGAAVATAGVALGRSGLIALGAGAVAVGAWMLLALRRGSQGVAVEAGPETGVADLIATEARTRAAFTSTVARLSLRGEVVEAPTLELPALLQRLQELERDLTGQLAMALDVGLAPRESDSDGTSQGQLTLGFDAATPAAVEPAAGAVVPSVAPGEATARLGAGRAGAERELAEAEAAQAALEARLSTLGDGDPDRGAGVAVERRTALSTARELRRELARSHSDLGQLQAEIERAVQAGEPWTRDPHALTALQRRRVDLTRGIEELGRSLERDEQSIVRLREQPDPDEVDGELLALREERAELARERDRKVLLARLIRLADHRFREERQPRVLRRAGDYLTHITEGRYSRIVSAEEADREIFKLRGDGYQHAVSLDGGVSTGTREQAYLALRLAAVDELDVGGERLPVFVDEVFVNWDEDRRSRGIELMARLAEDRQVFVFTCHRDVESALERLGGCVVPLEAGRLRTLEGAG